MNPKLGLWHHGGFKVIRELSDSEYKGYKKAERRLSRFWSDLHLFMIVRLNYDDLKNLLTRVQDLVVKGKIAGEISLLQTNINRHILNYLSAVRTFLDHSETNLRSRYGTDSKKYRHFKDACSHAYDDNFSYRFLYKLRNYVQHCGMPIGSLVFETVTESKPGFIMKRKRAYRVLRFEFNRDDFLRKSKSWGSQLAKEIRRLPVEFDINKHITEMMKCLEMVAFTLIEDDFRELMQSARYVQQLLTPIKDMSGIPCIRMKDQYEENGEEIHTFTDTEFIPLPIVETVMSLGLLTEERG